MFKIRHYQGVFFIVLDLISVYYSFIIHFDFFANRNGYLPAEKPRLEMGGQSLWQMVIMALLMVVEMQPTDHEM
jgi:hypothetical protein